MLRDGIHPITVEEFAHVADIWEASVRATHDFLTEADIRFYKPLIWDQFLYHVDLASVRDVQGGVAGFVGVAAGKVEMLFVDPARRGQGIGRRLLEHAITHLDATRLDVNEQNAQAISFYLHMGFVVEDRSETDGMGKPYPLLHMRLTERI